MRVNVFEIGGDNMNLKELKDNVDFYMENGHADEEVVITLDEPSVGSRASCKVACVFCGFDWERGQVRIEPENKLVNKGNSLHDEKEMHLLKCIYDKITKIVCHCPSCDLKVDRQDKFCRRCGQKLKYNPEKIIHTFDYRTLENEENR